jgi:hypothetical protein
MAVIGLTADGKKIVTKSIAGPSAYAVAGFPITIDELTRVDAVIFSEISGGYRIAGTSISGNVVTVLIHYFDYDAGSDGASITVPANTNLSAQTVKLVVIGT